MQFQLRVNQDNTGAVGDVSDLPQARSGRKADCRCIDLQFSAAPVPKEDVRGSGSAKPGPPSKPVDRRQAVMKIAAPGAGMWVFSGWRADEFALRYGKLRPGTRRGRSQGLTSLRRMSLRFVRSLL